MILLFDLFLFVLPKHLPVRAVPHQHLRGHRADSVRRELLNSISASLWWLASPQLIWIFERGSRRDHQGRKQRLLGVHFRNKKTIVNVEGAAARCNRLEQLLFAFCDGCGLEEPSGRLIVVVNVVDTGGFLHDLGQTISHLAIVVLPNFVNLLHPQAPPLRISLELREGLGLIIRANKRLNLDQSADNLLVFPLDFLEGLLVIVDLGSWVHFYLL